MMNRLRNILRYFCKLELIFALAICNNLIGLLPALPIEVYIAICLVLLIGLIQKKFRPNLLCSLFLIYIPIEIFIASPDPVFRSGERFVVFAILFLVASPLIQSVSARFKRYRLLEYILTIVSGFSILSFFAYFLGINLMTRAGETYDIEVYLENAGKFGGLFRHSMILGPIAGLSTLFLLYRGFVNNSKFYFVLAALCTGSIMFSASRSSFVALIIGAIYLVYKYSNNKMKFIRLCVSAILIIVVTFPIWKSAMNGLESKQQANVSATGTFYSRENLWKTRINEFAYSPIVGVGFCAQNIKDKTGLIQSNGTIEPGSSWLAVLSMTGIIGFSLFVILFYNSYNAVRNNNSNKSVLLSSLLIFVAIHMVAEGYIFAGGNPLCAISWLIIGCCYDTKYDETVSMEKLNQ